MEGIRKKRARRHVAQEENKAINSEELMVTLKSKILEDFGSFAKFADSKLVKSWGFTSSSAYHYLMVKKVTSFPLLKLLCEHYKMGTLVKKTHMVKTVSYHYE